MVFFFQIYDIMFRKDTSVNQGRAKKFRTFPKIYMQGLINLI